MKSNTQKEQENEERSILSWIGLDEDGLLRIGLKRDLDLHEVVIFWFGLLFFWPVLIFIRRTDASGDKPDDHLDTSMVIMWVLILIGSFILVYLFEYPVRNYLMSVIGKRELSLLEQFLHHVQHFITNYSGLFIFGIGILSWLLINPWKTTVRKTMKESCDSI